MRKSAGVATAVTALAAQMAIALLASCTTPDEPGPTAEEQPQDGIILLGNRDRLKRLSVDLRGVHPSEAEYQAIEANPELYEAFADRYLQVERFLDRMEEIYNLRFWTTFVEATGGYLPRNIPLYIATFLILVLVLNALLTPFAFRPLLKPVTRSVVPAASLIVRGATPKTAGSKVTVLRP